MKRHQHMVDLLRPDLTTDEQIFNFQHKRELTEEDFDEIIEKTLTAAALWEEVKDRLHRSAMSLSGGQQQRVAIARAFVGEPKLLMADEPTGNLDGATGIEIAELMFRLNREHGTTLVLVTHDTHLASRCARRLSLSAGRLVGDERAAGIH